MKKFFFILGFLFVACTVFGAAKFKGDLFTPGGTASDVNFIKVTNDTTANLNSLTRDKGRVYFDDTLMTLVVDDGVNIVSVSGGGSVFADDVFRVQDDGDATKEIGFQASGITTGTLRTITMPDTNIDLGDIAGNDGWGDVVDADIVPDGDNTRDVGLVGTRFAEMHAAIFSANAGVDPGISMERNVTAPSGNAGSGIKNQGVNDLIFMTNNNGSADTGSIRYETGNALAGGFGSGSHIFQTGTPDGGGARGLLIFLDGSEGTSGDCWRSIDTGGSAGWSPCPVVTTFADDVFRVQDNADATKQIALEASAITTATTRTITMPDVDVDLADIGTNSTHRTGDGSDHADVASNTALLAAPEFSDAIFRVLGSGDPTKKLAFEIDGLTGSTTRTITMPDTDIDLADLAGKLTGTGSDNRIMRWDGVSAAQNTNISIGDGASQMQHETPGSTFTIRTVSTTAAQDSGDLALKTGDCVSGDCGDIIIQPGLSSGGGAVGKIIVARLFASSDGLSSQPSYSWNSNPDTGFFIGGGFLFAVFDANILWSGGIGEIRFRQPMLVDFDIIDNGSGDFTVRTADETTTTNSNSLVLATGSVVDGVGGTISLAPGAPSGTGDNGLIEFLAAAVLDKKTADPCGNAVEYPEASIFYNDTSNYLCFCDGTNDVQVHSPATACF